MTKDPAALMRKSIRNVSEFHTARIDFERLLASPREMDQKYAGALRPMFNSVQKEILAANEAIEALGYPACAGLIAEVARRVTKFKTNMEGLTCQ